MNWYETADRLMKIAAYEQWRQHIEQLAKNNPFPFKQWFGGKDRIYFPFVSQDTANSNVMESDKSVIEAIQEGGYTVTDYRAGYCQQGKRTFRIGKVLQQLKSQQLKEIQQKAQTGEMYNPEREQREVLKYWDELINDFTNSPSRAQNSSNEFTIVISQNPHDLAQMSTGRDWTSCMELPGDENEKGGSNHRAIFCEVQEGGLIAYLIRANDVEIKRPLARLHIRRFENARGENIAAPEQSVYGNPLAGFQEAVNGWINRMQPDVRPGMYKRRGGFYSDTFKDKFFAAPSKPVDVQQWMRGEGDDAVVEEWEVVNNVVIDYSYERAMREFDEEDGHDINYRELMDEKKVFPTKQQAQQYIDSHEMSYDDDHDDEWRYRLGGDWLEKKTDEDGNDTEEWENEPFSIQKKTHDNRSTMQSTAIGSILESPKGTYPVEIIEQVKNYLFNGQTTSNSLFSMKRDFIKKYPELITTEDTGSFSVDDELTYLNSLPDGDKKEQLIGALTNETLKKMDDPMNYLPYWKQDTDGIIAKDDPYQALASYHDTVLKPLEAMYKKLPEPIVQKLIGFAQKYAPTLPDRSGYDSPIPGRSMPNFGDNLHSYTIGILNTSGADTPVVQRYYESLLPNFSIDPRHSRLSFHDLGLAIGSLGENGRQFIPFFEKQLIDLQQGETWDGKFQTERKIEQVLWILDALKSGTGSSQKYRFWG